MNWPLFGAFLAVTLLLIVTPGPTVTLVVTTSARYGTRAGLTTVAGSTLGLILLLVAIALGLQWVLQHAAALFEALRWCGVAYLFYLGVQAWRGAGKPRADAPPGERVQFLRGFLVALTNPKTLVFFTAFLPQFVDPALPSGRQLFVLCAASALLALVSDSAWAVAGGLGRAWLTAPKRAKVMERISGSVLMAGGVWLSLARRPVG